MIRLDASIVIAHSDKIGARGTWKGTYGHHPLLATCDNTGELLAVMLREDNAVSNTGADHVKVLDTAIAQIPASIGGTCWSPSTATAPATRSSTTSPP